jgi:ATP-dependent Clp protease ATP-binding subunit ClpC
MAENTLHPSILLVWTLANRSACLSGSERIHPVYFLLACLEVMDDAYQPEASQMGFDAQALDTIRQSAAECRELSGLPTDELTKARRSLRRTLLEGATPLPMQMLHRSDDSRAIFNQAARRAADLGDSELTMTHVFRLLLENLPSEASGLLTSLPASPITDFGSGGKSESSPSGSTTSAAVRNRGKAAKSKTPILDELGRDLTELARAGSLPAVVGRVPEMTAIARYLVRTSKRNVIIVGDAGVGKTAVVEGLAGHLARPNAPEFLRRLRIVQISVSDLVAGTKYRGDMEERLQRLIAEVNAEPNIVLFLDEIHLVMKSGGAGESPMDIANILKPALAKDTFRCIGATTTEEFERYIKDDAAFLRRFQVLRLAEPSPSEAVEICRSWAARIEGIQSVHFEDEAISAAVELSLQFIHGRSLPDKAIDLLENAAAFVKVSSLTFSDQPVEDQSVIRRVDIENVLEEQYGIPVRQISQPDPARIGAALKAAVFGQDEAIESVVDSLRMLEGQRQVEPNRPYGIFLFLGPTGVGKTFMAEQLATALYGDSRTSICRINLNEYKESYDIARLIGAAPGLIGHDRQGVLFQFIEGHPQGLFLLDEVEKAHPEIQDFFLQIFDKGEAIDTRGRKANFRPYLFILTANIESSTEKGALGFAPAVAPVKGKPGKGKRSAELTRAFRPEFLGRIDRIVTFGQLKEADYHTLLGKSLERLAAASMAEYEIQITMDPDSQLAFAAACTAQPDGARGFERLFQHLLAVPLREFLAAGFEGETLHIRWDGETASFSQ